MGWGNVRSGLWSAMGSAVAGVLVGGLAVYGGMIHRGSSETGGDAVSRWGEGSPSTAPRASRIDAAAATRETVVSLEVGDEVGTGVIVDPGGVVVTNAWVLARALPQPSEVKVRARLANGRRLDATIVVADIREDLAVVRLHGESDEERFPAAPWGSSSALALGQELFAFSHPTGLPHSLMHAIVAATDRAGALEGLEGPLVQLDASSSLGGFGGPLFDHRGALVGLVTVGQVHAQGVAFALPADHVQGFLRSLVEPDLARAGTLGITLDLQARIPQAVRAMGYSAGLVVQDVRHEGVPEGDRLHSGDVIVGIRGQRFDDRASTEPTALAQQLLAHVRPLYTGEHVALEVVRNGRLKNLHVPIFAVSELEQVFIDAEQLLGVLLHRDQAIPTVAGVLKRSASEQYRDTLQGARITRWGGAPVKSKEDLGRYLAELKTAVRRGGQRASVVLGIQNRQGESMDILIVVDR